MSKSASSKRWAAAHLTTPDPYHGWEQFAPRPWDGISIKSTWAGVALNHNPLKAQFAWATPKGPAQPVRVSQFHLAGGVYHSDLDSAWLEAE